MRRLRAQVILKHDLGMLTIRYLSFKIRYLRYTGSFVS